MLHTKQRPVALEKRGADVFYANHPDFDRFLLRFGRDEGSSVTDLSYGPEWYHAASYQGPTALDYPAEWERYVGHYRSHNPWQTNFRVILRQGRLWLVLAGGEEDSLIHLEENTFRIGDELSPERLTFAQFAGDHALCVNL